MEDALIRIASVITQKHTTNERMENALILTASVITQYKLLMKSLQNVKNTSKQAIVKTYKCGTLRYLVPNSMIPNGATHHK